MKPDEMVSYHIDGKLISVPIVFVVDITQLLAGAFVVLMARSVHRLGDRHSSYRA
jgi:hypothetical protein